MNISCVYFDCVVCRLLLYINMSPIFLLLVIVGVAPFSSYIPTSSTASCQMKLSETGQRIGEVRFWFEGLVGLMEVRVQSPRIREGYHGLHAHTGPVKGHDCNSTGEHYNPTGKPHGGPISFFQFRHVGDFGNVIANQYGQINWQSKFFLKQSDANKEAIRMEGVHYVPARSLNLYKRSVKRKNRKTVKVKVRAETSEHIPIIEEPDDDDIPDIHDFVYYATYYVNDQTFSLDGDTSLLGRSMVLHETQDDLGRNRNAKDSTGKKIACCTIESEND